MTERLYYDDAYLTSFDAKVEEIVERDGKWLVRLDRSAFYPTSGGQPFDTGMLGDAHVVDVNVEAGEVWHTVDAALCTGQIVHGEIDWPRRFDHMQQHAGDHMIAGSIWRLLGGVTIGLHTSDEVSTIDVSMPDGATRISEEDIRRIELDVNARIQQNEPIHCWFPSAEELEWLPLRKRPTVSEHVRVVAIGDDEMVACGGTHPSSAGQLGLVKILSVAPARGKMRVSFVAGMRAYRDYLSCHTAAHIAAERFSTGVEQLVNSIDTLKGHLHEVETAWNRLRRDQLLASIDEMLVSADVLPDGTRLVSRLVEADAGLLRDLASKLIERPGIIALLGAKSEGQVLYVFGRSVDGSMNMGELLREVAKPLGGKGGGRPDFAQGGGSEAILDAARAKLLGLYATH